MKMVELALLVTESEVWFSFFCFVLRRINIIELFI